MTWKWLSEDASELFLISGLQAAAPWNRGALPLVLRSHPPVKVGSTTWHSLVGWDSVGITTRAECPGPQAE